MAYLKQSLSSTSFLYMGYDALFTSQFGQSFYSQSYDQNYAQATYAPIHFQLKDSTPQLLTLPQIDQKTSASEDAIIQADAPNNAAPSAINLSDLLAVNGGDGSLGTIFNGIDAEDIQCPLRVMLTETGLMISSSGPTSQIQMAVSMQVKAMSYSGQVWALQPALISPL